MSARAFVCLNFGRRRDARMSTEEDIWCVTLRKKVERKSNQHLFLRDKKNQKEEQNQKKKNKNKKKTLHLDSRNL